MILAHFDLLVNILDKRLEEFIINGEKRGTFRSTCYKRGKY